MATATTYNVSGVREDLTDALTTLAPDDCPKTSTFPKSPAPKSAYQEWQVDTLAAVSFSGQLEGADISSTQNKSVNRSRLGNYVQNFGSAWSVSRNLEAADVAGVSSEVAYAKSKTLLELKRSIEAMIGSDNDRQADNGTVPGKSRALGLWISVTPGSDVPAAFRTPTASIDTTATASLAESNFNDVFQSTFQKVGGRRDYTLYAGPSLKRAISNFQRVTGATGTTKTYQVTQAAKEHRVDLSVSIYEGDFHVVSVVPDLFNGILDGADPGAATDQQKARGYVINPELVGIGYQFGFESQELPDFGGGRNGWIRSCVTLMVKNPLGLGKFAATS